jgi:hypothetical protein
VAIDPEGVTVSNFTRVDRLAWPEISAIELQKDLAPGGTTIRCVAFVQRGSGEPAIARATFSLSTRRRLLEALRPLARKWGVTFDVPPDVLPPD